MPTLVANETASLLRYYDTGKVVSFICASCSVLIVVYHFSFDHHLVTG